MKTKVDVRMYLLDVFSSDPEVQSVQALADLDEEVGGRLDHAEVRAACEILVAEGKLQRAGREGYEATEDFMRYHGHEV